VYALDNEELMAAIDRSLKAAPGRTIAQACEDVARPEDTTVDLDGPVREARELGPAAYIASPRRALRLSGTVKPPGEGARIDIWRHTTNGWEYFDTMPAEPDGSFEVALKAYRAESNVYRLDARGGEAARSHIGEIYFDRPPP
jgi:hypothetical protein